MKITVYDENGAILAIVYAKAAKHEIEVDQTNGVRVEITE